MVAKRRPLPSLTLTRLDLLYEVQRCVSRRDLRLDDVCAMATKQMLRWAGVHCYGAIQDMYERRILVRMLHEKGESYNEYTELIDLVQQAINCGALKAGIL